MSELLTHLIPVLEQANLTLSPEQLEKLDRHFRLLLEWNSRMNLTAITDPRQAAIFHYLDSLAAAPVIAAGPPVHTWVDVGSGGGFPGLPLAVMFAVEHWILTDGQGKKAAFLKESIHRLRLAPRVNAFIGRVEAGTIPALLPFEARENWGITARALERMEKQIPKLLKLPGLQRAVFWCGAVKADNAAQTLSPQWNTTAHQLPSGTNRFLLSFNKTSFTGPE